MKCIFLLVPLLLLTFGAPLPCQSQEDLDPDFGTNGQLITEFSVFDDLAFAVTVQPDGKILVAGTSENGADTDIAIARYLPDGSPDSDFNFNGQLTIAVGSGNDSGLALIVQEDGKILVAGTTDNGSDLDVAVIRVLQDGLPDPSFGTAGQVIIKLPRSDDRAQAILLQGDSKIILAGVSEAAGESRIFLARIHANGSLDQDFANSGPLEINGAGNSAALGAARQDNGRILVAGFSTTNGRKRASLFAFKDNGDLDQSFGSKGIALSGTEQEDSLFYDLKVLDNGQILATGASIGSHYRSVLLAKFGETGKAWSPFNGKGLVTTDLGSDSVAYGIAIAQDRSIYLAGSSSPKQDSDFILLHFSSTGYPLTSQTTVPIVEEEEEETVIVLSPLQLQESIDQRQAYTLTDFASYNDVARSLYILNDGTILLVGSANNGSNTDFALLRYTPEELATIRQSGGIYTREGKYIATTRPSEITRNSAASGGFIKQHTKDPATTVSKRGVCYGISPAPGLKDFAALPIAPPTTDLNPFKTAMVSEACTSDGTGDGEFRSSITDLSPGTTYYIRSYAVLSPLTSSSSTVTSSSSETIAGTTSSTSTSSTTDLSAVVEGTVIYGNELQFSTEDACFIATAAHGNINSIQVRTLRQFRDHYLKSTPLGALFINTYYQLSPPLARRIAQSESLQQITRIVLAPITTLSYFALHPILALQVLATLLGIATLFQIVPRLTFLWRRCPLDRQGFTLIELLVVLVIIGILAGYVGPQIMGRPEDAKRTMAAAQISGLETALESYRLDNGAYPSTDQGLQALVEPPSVGKLPPKWRKGGYMRKNKVPNDPWGNEYIYLSPGSHGEIDISSYGSDRESGGEDADRDVNNWELE